MFNFVSLKTLHETVFVSNAAGEEGPAVKSMGTLESLSDVTFKANTFYCPIGYYGYEKVRSL